jgi:arabinofuranan 3-O-arabinosyltransferase
LAGGELPVTLCGGSTLSMSASRHELSLTSSATTLVRRVVLTSGAGLAGSTSGSAGARAQVLRWGSTSRTVRVNAPASTVLVVHENFNRGWQASLAGHRLSALQVDGWQQAFLLPAGAHGTVTLTYLPQRSFAVGLWLGLLAVAVLIGLALLMGRGGGHHRSDGGPGWPAGQDNPIGGAAILDGRLDRRVLAVLLMVGLGLIAGWLALALGTVVVVGWLCLPAVRTVRRWLPGVAAGGVAGGGLLNAIGPSVSSHPLTDSAACQGLVLLALTALALAVLAEE